MLNHTLFISDLHLEPSNPQLTALFFTFLEKYAQHADALYILGDFFEVWLGDDNTSEFNQNIIAALKKFTDSGIPTYFMRGNRDFLIGQRFAHETGCRLLADPTVIQLYNMPLLLSHGDSLCTDDKLHILFRKYAHNPAYNRWFLLLPLTVRLFLARKIRNKSQKRVQKLPYQIMDVNAQAVLDILTHYNVSQLIHGHTHKPAKHLLMNHGLPAARTVLGAWHEQGNMLIYRKDGSTELFDFTV